MKTFKSLLPEIQLRYKTTELKKVKIGCSEDGYKLLKQLYEEDTLEYLETSVALFLNRCNNTIGWLKISQGGMSGTVVDGKVVFATALQCGASGIILSHNHPSGNAEPSASDISLTKALVKVGTFLDMPVLDHLIITSKHYYSFADAGTL